MATPESVPDPETGETPAATETAGSPESGAPAGGGTQGTVKKEEEKPIHHRDNQEGVVGIITAFVLAIPVRFVLDLVHIIWLAVILQRYAKAWPDGMSQGGTKSNIDGATACIHLFEYERKMLVAEIVLFTIDLATIGATCFAACRMDKGLDEATLYSVVALTPSYLVRIGMSVGGMYWANVAWDQDRGKCTDLWYGGVGLFVIAAGFVIWAWVCIVIYDFWKQCSASLLLAHAHLIAVAREDWPKDSARSCPVCAGGDSRRHLPRRPVRLLLQPQWAEPCCAEQVPSRVAWWSGLPL